MSSWPDDNGSIGDGGDLLDTFKGEVFPAKTVPYFGYAVNNYAEVISDVITAFKNYIEIIKGDDSFVPEDDNILAKRAKPLSFALPFSMEIP